MSSQFCLEEELLYNMLPLMDVPRSSLQLVVHGAVLANIYSKSVAYSLLSYTLKTARLALYPVAIPLCVVDRYYI